MHYGTKNTILEIVALNVIYQSGISYNLVHYSIFNEWHKSSPEHTVSVYCVQRVHLLLKDNYISVSI